MIINATSFHIYTHICIRAGESLNNSRCLALVLSVIEPTLAFFNQKLGDLNFSLRFKDTLTTTECGTCMPCI
jgi:hypothetical protein